MILVVSTSLPSLIAFCFCLFVLFACFFNSNATLLIVYPNAYTEAQPSVLEADFILRKSL